MAAVAARYVCNRCGYACIQRTDMRRHCERKRRCPPTVSQDPPDFISTRHGRHDQAVPPTSADLVDIKAQLDAIQASINDKPPPQVINNNNINNINKTVNICVFGKEDLSHVTKEAMLQCFTRNSQDPYKALQDIVALVYFRNRHPAFLIDGVDGDAWYLEKTVECGGHILPIFAKKPAQSLVKEVCFKGVDIMDDAYNKNSAEYYVLPELEKQMVDDDVERYADFIQDASTLQLSSYYNEDLAEIESKLMSDTAETIHVGTQNCRPILHSSQS